ncbi:hypothetical protein ES708_25352 [subsurface metagenome]
MANAAFESATSLQPDKMSPAAIQPRVPPTRILPKSFSESSRFIKAIEFVRARVGAYKRQYRNISHIIDEYVDVRYITRRSTPPVNCRKAMTFCVEKYLSAICPPINGEMIVARGKRL